MAEILIERSCQRFRQEISPEDDGSIRASSIDDVRQAIRHIERQLAARQCLRNLDRLNPYLDGIERYSKAIDVLANAVPFLPYVWAPLKLILTVTQDSTHTLDKILSAYAQIGAALPRLSMLGGAFPDNADFQQLFAFLYEDIIEFHSRAYKLIRKPAWNLFFSSAWSRFEHRFNSLVESIKATSQLIDQHATAINILQAKEWRQKSMDESVVREKRWESEQLQAVLNWLNAVENEQDIKHEWLKEQCFPGTAQWIVQNSKFRSWMQRGRGNSVMWLFGKPGSGKSVLASTIISFMQSNPKQRALYFFCDYHTPAYGISAYIFRVFCSQILRFSPELAPFFYDEYSSKGLSPSAMVLKEALSKTMKSIEFVRLVVDGIDELPSSEHRKLISELIDLATSSGDTCKLLISSQDLPSIRPSLSRRSTLFLGDETEPIRKDIGYIVEKALVELDDALGGELGGDLLENIRANIMSKAEGMFLWVRLVLSLLESCASPWELKSTIDSLPKDLEEAYAKILNNIRGRCSPTNLGRLQRVFEWLLFSKEKTHVRKYSYSILQVVHSHQASPAIKALHTLASRTSYRL
ncbi:hypothetical protein F4819DRAFT_429846 [Hypoxylon fuscum]|nr:hypothetical protein F4819DRAFT_429846 [Hypoxylon fuscum]